MTRQYVQFVHGLLAQGALGEDMKIDSPEEIARKARERVAESNRKAADAIDTTEEGGIATDEELTEEEKRMFAAGLVPPRFQSNAP